MTEDAHLILSKLLTSVTQLSRSANVPAVPSSALLHNALQVIISAAELARELARANVK